jgi:hypothetical protein
MLSEGSALKRAVDVINLEDRLLEAFVARCAGKILAYYLQQRLVPYYNNMQLYISLLSFLLLLMAIFALFCKRLSGSTLNEFICQTDRIITVILFCASNAQRRIKIPIKFNSGVDRGSAVNDFDRTSVILSVG